MTSTFPFWFYAEEFGLQGLKEVGSGEKSKFVGDENMEDESELDDNDITGPAGMGINNVILSFAQVLNNSTMIKKLGVTHKYPDFPAECVQKPFTQTC